MTRYQFRSWSARILFAIMAFSILAFGAVETWAITVIEVSILSMAIAWMIRRLVAPYRLIWNPLVVPLALVPAIAGIQYAQNWTATPYQTAGEALKWLSFAFFFFLCANVFRDSEIRRKFSIALVWFGFLLAVLALVQFYTSPNLIYWTRPAPGAQVFGPFVDKNHFAVLMELLLPAALLLALRESDKQLIYFVLCGLMLASVVVCASRAGAVVVATEVLAVLSVSALLGKGRGTHGSRARLLASVGALTVVAVCLTLAAGTEKLAQRFKTVEKGINRAEVAAATWEIFETRPLRGYGLGSFQFVFPAFAPFDDGHRWDHAHNDPLQFAMELGIAGPIAILALIVLLFMGRYPQETWLGRILPLAGAGMHSLVEFPFQIPGLVIVSLALLAHVRPTTQHRRSSLSSPETGRGLPVDGPAPHKVGASAE